MKMIGVARLRARERTSRAVSKPSMPGIATSRMISAKSCSSRRASASTPDRASTSLRPSGSSAASIAIRLVSLSSTTRMSLPYVSSWPVLSRSGPHRHRADHRHAVVSIRRHECGCTRDYGLFGFPHRSFRMADAAWINAPDPVARIASRHVTSTLSASCGAVCTRCARLDLIFNAGYRVLTKLERALGLAVRWRPRNV